MFTRFFSHIIEVFCLSFGVWFFLDLKFSYHEGSPKHSRKIISHPTPLRMQHTVSSPPKKVLKKTLIPETIACAFVLASVLTYNFANTLKCLKPGRKGLAKANISNQDCKKGERSNVTLLWQPERFPFGHFSPRWQRQDRLTQLGPVQNGLDSTLSEVTKQA